MYKFCKKCGHVGYKRNNDICRVCKQHSMIPVPSEYIGKDEILTNKEAEKRAIRIREELVKNSPEVDPYLFEHREELKAIDDKRIAKNNAIMARAMESMGNQDKGNSYGVECPYCHATNVKKIGGLSRMASVGFWGLGSKKIGKQWHCTKCGSDF